MIYVLILVGIGFVLAWTFVQERESGEHSAAQSSFIDGRE